MFCLPKTAWPSDLLNLWTGPLNLQDKTAYLKDSEKATDQQIWYLPQLLEGMEGQSVPTKKSDRSHVVL